ncbi:MAG TPA: hypothetical protein VJS39_01140 [Gemmatimonadaceae bacterium]|nr:hypothetical protein [Gemmatimonadaceae bacterium]
MLKLSRSSPGSIMRETSKTYAALVCGALLVAVSPAISSAQVASSGANTQTCAALLSNDSSVGARVGVADSAARRDTAKLARPDSVSFGVGGARTGNPTVYLYVGVHADEVRFAKQPNARVRLCWGGDTLRVVERQNLPSPVVAGTTYRNVYVAVELIGRLNGQCLSNAIGVGNEPTTPRAGVAQTAAPQPSASSCAFLGGTAGAGQANPRPPNP